MEVTTRKLVRDYGGTVLGAVTVALLIRFFVIEAYRIPTPAMKPTLEPGDTVFVVKAPAGTRLFGVDTQRRGNVVLFRPEDSDGREYIKRILAVAGETVQIQQGKLSINGQLLHDEILANGNCGIEPLPDGVKSPVCYEPPPTKDFGPTKIPEGSVFVLGDFRSAQHSDALTLGKGWGIIPTSWIKGRALWVWLSVEPPTTSEMGVSSERFPKVRFERMFRRIE